MNTILKKSRMPIVLKLINDERTNSKRLATKACIIEDVCEKDYCTMIDFLHCHNYASDICKYDFGESCIVMNAMDECEIDYNNDCSIARRDTCGWDQ